MRAKGAPEEEIEAYRNARQKSSKTQDDSDFEVWPENWPALLIFVSVKTQWRIIAGMGGASFQGIDYPALIEVIKLKVEKDQRSQMFDDVQLIELGALSELNRKKDG